MQDARCNTLACKCTTLATPACKMQDACLALLPASQEQLASQPLQRLCCPSICRINVTA